MESIDYKRGYKKGQDLYFQLRLRTKDLLRKEKRYDPLLKAYQKLLIHSVQQQDTIILLENKVQYLTDLTKDK